MQYLLMHKDIPVMEIEIDEATYGISRIGEIYQFSHIPLGVLTYQKKVDRAVLNHWWMGRSIPLSRSGLREALEVMDIPMPQTLIEKCLGLSLSDQYWICPARKDMKWSEVNFFQNEFSEDVGNILFGMKPNSKRLDLMSPDNTSDGYLKKKWKIIDGKRYLIKGGNGQVQQEPFNEVFATEFMKQMGEMQFVSYGLLWEQDMPYSICEDFIDENTELISAADMMKIQKRPNHVSEYHHFLHCCDILGIPNASESIHKMLTLDFLIANDDRHFHNFGAVRNAETLEWIGIAPIFDCGNAMWHNQPTSRIETKCVNTPSRTFKKTHEEQIKLVPSFQWLNQACLEQAVDICREVYSKNPFMDAHRLDTLCVAMDTRTQFLKDILQEQVHKNDIGEITIN